MAPLGMRFFLRFIQMSLDDDSHFTVDAVDIIDYKVLQVFSFSLDVFSMAVPKLGRPRSPCRRADETSLGRFFGGDQDTMDWMPLWGP